MQISMAIERKDQGSMAFRFRKVELSGTSTARDCRYSTAVHDPREKKVLTILMESGDN